MANDPTPTPSPAPTGQDANATTPKQKDIVLDIPKKNKSKVTGKSKTTSIVLTPKDDAYSELDREMIALFGRRATASEKSAYYKGLNAAEKHYATVTRSTEKDGDIPTTETTGTNYAFSKDNFLFEFTSNLADTYIKAGKPLGGKAGEAYQQLKAYSAAMGVSDDDKTALKNTIKIVRGQADVVSLKEGMRKRAISLYGGLADALQRDPTLTVKEAASDYINIMSNMLDINANSISLHDPTLSKALNATKDGKPYAMNLNEFTTQLRSDARFQYSTMAHQEARDLASQFAQAFGFGG